MSSPRSPRAPDDLTFEEKIRLVKTVDGGLRRDMVSNILGIIEQSNNCERLMRAGSVPALLHIVKTEEKARE